ncbi:hypothetical protein GOY13_01790 [Wolbachia endosymbiont of Cruorifilaria tuberocauda]|uniref:hypothetical protein n=1 Tax=Wolbachia endosymbiont of Cruorifilaria tuberocauda TaxID=1812111 RepID=UPI001589202C|nr:hypothetical protein [Wolbachia endosymbiont of Cruorifilaria tuberocauda]QKX01668.1 hypothetical protein GOY13_01790 [Wolbachia endosymbiont of Cruorifilaria tuberocauda]
MLNELKKKQNTFEQKVHDAYNHDIKKIICITAGLTALLCKVSLQFCCEFINNNRSNIHLIHEIAQWAKFPTFVLLIAHSGFTLRDLIEDYMEPDGKKELLKIVGKLAGLLSNAIEVSIMLQIFHLLTEGNANIINYVHLTSTILFLFISEPISCYYTCKRHQEVYRKCHDKSDTNKFVESKKELSECKKDLIVSILTLSLGLLNFIFKRIDIAATPINLGNGIVYSFNLSVTVSIICSAVLLLVWLDKLFNQPTSDDLSTGLNRAHHTQLSSNLPNGHTLSI